MSKASVLDDAAQFGNATSSRYRTTFFKENPDLRGKVVVHHGVEQQAMRLYPGEVTWQEMHSLENLRGIPKALNNDLHLSKIRKEWNKFYLQNPEATKLALLRKATEIDRTYGHLFNPVG